MAKRSGSQSDHHATLGELERYKVLVDNVQDYAIFFMDEDGTILTWNRGAERTKGYKPSEIIGKNFSIFYSQEDKQARKPQRELEIASKHGRVEDEDWRVRKDGSKFWANVVITALFDDNHELIGFAKVTRDITTRKQQEDALRSSNRLLKQQQAELERLNESKDDFISLASHQLRTPATIVKQMLGILVEGLYGPVPDDLLPIITKAYESNERQIRIVDTLLNIAQLDAGKVTLHPQTVHPDRLLSNIVSDYKDTFKRNHQTAKLSLPAKTVPSQLDPVNLRMALTNLVDNASKYSPKGSTITINLSQTDAEDIISICDQGVGIAPEDHTKLFGKFSRIHNELSDMVGGSGLGLYWTDKIVELHGGHITVTSEIGNGTTFTLHLPRKATPDA